MKSLTGLFEERLEEAVRKAIQNHWPAVFVIIKTLNPHTGGDIVESYAVTINTFGSGIALEVEKIVNRSYVSIQDDKNYGPAILRVTAKLNDSQTAEQSE